MKYTGYIRLVLMLVLSLGLVMPTGAAEIDEVLKQQMLETYEFDAQTYTIEITSNRLQTRIVNSDDVTFRAISLKEPLGSFTIRVTIASEGKIIEEGQVRLNIRKYEEVLIASDKIRRHQELATGQFELTRTDVTSLREQPVRCIEDIAGQRSKRNLCKGHVLTMAAMEPVPDIEVGGEVNIVYTDGLCRITVPGKVLQTGWTGKKVRVKNINSGKVILARVVDSRSVAVDP